MTADGLWTLRRGQTLQYRHWDDEYVLYNDLSGDTHLLDDAAIVLLTALQRGPASRGGLVDVLCAEFDADPAELDSEADALLVHLKRLYLIDSPAC